MEHCKQKGDTHHVSEGRYSSLPSRNTLEVHGEHAKIVDQRRLSAISRIDVAANSLKVDYDITTADIFISNSFKGYVDVIRIAKMLQDQNSKLSQPLLQVGIT